MANKIHDAFGSIHADDRLKEATKQFIEAEYAKKPKIIYQAAFRRFLAVACMALILTAGFGGYSWMQVPVSYVSIDVNPSIELALNRLDRVVSVTAYNEEGEEIIKDIALDGKKYTDAIEAIVHNKTMSAYITDNSEIVFTVAAGDGHNRELTEGVKQCSGNDRHGSQSVSADIGIVQKAHEMGISLGKYYAWLQLRQYDGSVTIDDCKDMSVSQIHGLVKEHEQGCGHGVTDSSMIEDNIEDSAEDDSIIEDDSMIEDGSITEDGGITEEWRNPHGHCGH